MSLQKFSQYKTTERNRKKPPGKDTDTDHDDQDSPYQQTRNNHTHHNNTSYIFIFIVTQCTSYPAHFWSHALFRSVA